MRTLCLACALAIIGSALSAGSTPVPLVNNPLVPDSATPGSGGFTLTVNGTGFISTSLVNWNGSPRVTSFVSHSKLTATILDSDVATAGTASITVVSPSPSGGGRASNVVYFPVATPSLAAVVATATNYSISNGYTLSIATADLNGDGNLDLVSGDATNTGGAITVFLGNGDGTFSLGQSTALGSSASASGLFLADFNNDGKLDLPFIDGAQVGMLLGNGDGTFTTVRPTAAGPFGVIAAPGDYNGDGNLDFIGLGNGLTVLLGNGNGSFQTAVYPVNGNLLAAVSGDFNRDGHLDLAVAGSNGMSILLGNGDGTFQAPVVLPGNFNHLVTADLNGDGILDLAATDTDGRIFVILGKGDGAFRRAHHYSTGQTAADLTCGDFNSDGKLDLAVASNASFLVGAVSILLGNGDGTFQPAAAGAGRGAVNAFGAGDFNGDGRLDIAAAQGGFFGGDISIDLQTSVAVAPAILSFAPTVENTSSPAKTVTVTNLGAAALNISGITLTGFSQVSEFAVISDGCTGNAVPPSASCMVGLTFTPTSVGAQPVLLNVTDDAFVTPQTAAIIGYSTPMALTPAHLDFGSVKVGSSSKEKIIIATNVTTSPVSILRIVMDGHDAKDFKLTDTCGHSLKPKSGCSIEVQFIPTAGGVRTGAVSFQLNVGNTQTDPAKIRVSGTGI